MESSLEQIAVALPVKSLATGMKVRDNTCGKYIFTAADREDAGHSVYGRWTICRPGAAAEQFVCHVAGNMTIRGVARAFAIDLSVKDQPSQFRAQVACDGRCDG